MSIKLQTAERDYSKEDVENLREEMIRLRNGSLAQSDFHWSVVLSHVIAVLSLLKDQME